jgi:hypothetical protein
MVVILTIAKATKTTLQLLFGKGEQMIRGLRLAHFIGLVMFLGSIFTFTLISSLTQAASLENLVFGREVISAGTRVLTLPGMWLMAITGLLMTYRRYGFSLRFSQLKLLLIGLIILNAYFFILPGEETATDLARRSLVQQQLLPEYDAAYMRESIFGAINVVLTIAAAVVGVWKIGGKAVPRLNSVKT